MTLLRLPFVPLQQSYAVEPLNLLETEQVRGGLPRGRLDGLGQTYVVNIKFAFNLANYERFMAFYRTVGNGPFEMQLMTEAFELAPHEVRFVPDTLKTPTRVGNTTEVEVQLVAKPIAPMTAAEDEALVALFNEYGANGPNVLALLAKLVNEDLP